jgi:hypothetical protein
MKNITFIVCLCIAVIGSCIKLNAATEQWSADGKSMIGQVAADGKGGCALIRMETNSVHSILWVDKKGAAIYEAGVSNASIISCSNKQLLYSDDLNGSEIVQVDSKGGTTKISKPGEEAYASFFGKIIPSSVMSDKKGFFGVKMDIITSRQKLVRFSNK